MHQTPPCAPAPGSATRQHPPCAPAAGSAARLARLRQDPPTSHQEKHRQLQSRDSRGTSRGSSADRAGMPGRRMASTSSATAASFCTPARRRRLLRPRRSPRRPFQPSSQGSLGRATPRLQLFQSPVPRRGLTTTVTSTRARVRHLPFLALPAPRTCRPLCPPALGPATLRARTRIRPLQNLALPAHTRNSPRQPATQRNCPQRPALASPTPPLSKTAAPL